MISPNFIIEEDFCGNFCNDIAISKDTIFNVEMSFETKTIKDEFSDISILPTSGEYIEIGDVLTIPNPPNFNPTALCVAPFTPNSTILLYTANKLRIYSIEYLGLTNYAILYQTDAIAIYRVKYANNSNTMCDRLIDAINDVDSLDNNGSFSNDAIATVTNTGTGITIVADNIFAYQSENISGITPTQNPTPNYFGYRTYWNPITKSANWFNFDLYSQCNPSGATSSGSGSFYRNFFNEFVGYENGCYNLKMKFTNTQNFNIRFPYRLKSAGGFWTAPIDIIIPANTENYLYEINGNIPNYSLAVMQFETLDITSESGGTELQTIEEWFSLNDIIFEIREKINSIDIKDCNGTTNIINNDCNSAIMPIDLSGYNGYVQFTLNTNNANYTSIPYSLIEDKPCNSYIKFRFSKLCNPYVNELYLLGTRVKTKSEIIANESFINSFNKKISVYKHKISVYEFSFLPYTSNVMESLEKLFMYDVIALDDKLYYTGDNILQVDEIDDDIYTSRIDLYLDGSEIVSKLCCD